MGTEKQVAAKLKDYELTFETPHGKRVLYDLVQVSNMLTTSYRIGEDSASCVFRDGQRSMGIYVLQKLNTDPAKLLALIKRGKDG